MKYLIWFLSLVVLLGGVYVWDITHRYYSPHCINKKAFKTFYNIKTETRRKEIFKQNFSNPEFDFPQNSVKRINVSKNIAVVGYLTSYNLSPKNQNKLIAFFRNPDNFTWDETTWNIHETDYHIRIYDNNNKLIGKILLCSTCKMCQIFPFTPDIKYGNIKNNKISLLLSIIKQI